MFKRSITILLFIAFVVQTFNNGFVILGYCANTAAFAKNCVNKAIPQMHCNGKCQLVKKLQEETRKDQQTPERKYEKKMEVLSSNSFLSGIQAIKMPFSDPVAKEKNYSLKSMAYSFFHPPQA